MRNRFTVALLAVILASAAGCGSESTAKAKCKSHGGVAETESKKGTLSEIDCKDGTEFSRDVNRKGRVRGEWEQGVDD